MFQPRMKLEIVKHLCPPREGWVVFVDIDPSEEGRTGGERKTQESRERQQQMQDDAPRVRGELQRLGVHIGERAVRWRAALGPSVPSPKGDRDVIAIHRERRRALVVEVEGVSSGQPETKLYKAAGQIVAAVHEVSFPGYETRFGIAVIGDDVAAHLARMRPLERLGVFGVAVASSGGPPQLVFGALG